MASSVKTNVNRIHPQPETSPLSAKEAHRFSTSNETSNSSLLVTGSSSSLQEGLLGNSTPSGLLSHTTTRTVHMQPRMTVNHPPQYGNFYSEYDPMTGARTAAILGSLLLLLVFYIIYKAKCHQPWTEEDDFYLQQYKQRQANKALTQAQQGGQDVPPAAPRRGTHYVIDPVCSPDPTILAATAKWIQMQPLEESVPDPATGQKRRSRLALTKYLSFSAEHLNRQLMHSAPLVPNGHGPPNSSQDEGEDRERSCNEYVPNGFLKYIHKESINGPDWLYDDSQDSPSHRGPVEFYIEEEEDRHHRRRASSHDDSMYKGDREVDELFSDENQKPRKKKSGKHQLEHFSSLDRHNNNDELEDRTLQLDPDSDICTNCLSDRNSSLGALDPQAMFLPANREILLTPTPRRSRVRSRSQQRSQDRSSLESHQRSVEEDESPELCVSVVPELDAVSVSLDMTSSMENTTENHSATALTSVPMLSYIDNLTNNSTFSTMSTATASSTGSYQSEGQDIPLADLSLPLTPHGGVVLTPQPHSVVDVSIETALASSCKSHDQLDTKL